MTLFNLIKEVLQDSRLWTHEEFPFTAHIVPGDKRVALIVGENASGKSLLVQSIAAFAHRHNIHNVSVSIRERTGAGLHDMAGMRRTMMFGDESEQSTGATSVRVMEPAFNTIRSRAEEKLKSILLFDEPDLGLSEGYACAMGTYLAREVKKLPELVLGTAILTHSRALAKALAAELGHAPTFVKMGSKQSFAEWLEGENAKTVEELFALHEAGHKNWLKVHQLLDSFRNKKSGKKS